MHYFQTYVASRRVICAGCVRLWCRGSSVSLPLSVLELGDDGGAVAGLMTMVRLCHDWSITFELTLHYDASKIFSCPLHSPNLCVIHSPSFFDLDYKLSQQISMYQRSIRTSGPITHAVSSFSKLGSMICCVSGANGSPNGPSRLGSWGCIGATAATGCIEAARATICFFASSGIASQELLVQKCGLRSSILDGKYCGQEQTGEASNGTHTGGYRMYLNNLNMNILLALFNHWVALNFWLSSDLSTYRVAYLNTLELCENPKLADTIQM